MISYGKIEIFLVDLFNIRMSDFKSIAKAIRDKHIKNLQKKNVCEELYYFNVLPCELMEELLLYFKYKELIEFKDTLLCNYLTKRYWIKKLVADSGLPSEAFIDILREPIDDKFYKLVYNTMHVRLGDVITIRTALYNQSLVHGYVSMVKYIKEHDVKLIYHVNKHYKNYDTDAILLYLAKDKININVVKAYIELKLMDMDLMHRMITKRLLIMNKKFQDDGSNKHLEKIAELTKAKDNIKIIMETLAKE